MTHRQVISDFGNYTVIFHVVLRSGTTVIIIGNSSKEMGGGAMMDMGVYPLQAARYATGLRA
jgi:predicted dehydrogenase